MTALDSPAASGALAAVPAQARGLLAEGRKRGFLTSDQISDALQELPLTAEQLENILSWLSGQGIRLLESDEPLADGMRRPASPGYREVPNKSRAQVGPKREADHERCYHYHQPGGAGDRGS